MSLRRGSWAAVLGAAIVVCLAQGAGAAPAAMTSRQVLVKFGPARGGPRVQDQRRVPAGARVLKPLPLAGWELVELPANMSPAEGVRWFRSRPDVIHAEPNVRWRLHAVPDDPQYARLYGLDRIGAPAAWEVSHGSSNVVVAVVDTGTTLTHPDLQPNLWRNPGEVAGNGIDDDANGWIDDVFGWDFFDGDADPTDDAGHGTHVAGTIGAAGNNGRGVSGVCWDVRLMTLRVGAVDGFGTTFELAGAFDYAVRMRRRGVNLRAINCSWGGGFPSAALKEAICEAGAAGILVVCSAGNDRQDNDAFPAYPAGYDCPEILTVAASTSCDDPASFSNYGQTTVHLAAPGNSILSTIRGGERYAILSGTSMSAPHVTGAAALLFAANPGLTVSQARALLIETVDKSPVWEGKVMSGGRLNLARAVEHAVAGTLPGPSMPAGSSSKITAASRTPEGHWGNGDSREPALSADGRWVAFTSAATNLVTGDREGFADVFLRDQRSNTVVRVSRTPDGAGGNGDSGGATVSADGQFVAFSSKARNLVANDGNDVADVFVWDRETRQLELVSVRAGSGGVGTGVSELPSINGDGSLIAFASEARDLVTGDRNAARDVFVRDRVRRTTVRVSVANDGSEARGWSDSPAINGDGSVVVFYSSAPNLVAGDSNDAWDVFLRDRQANRTELVSVAADGQSPGNGDSVLPTVSADGRYVLFSSVAGNLDGKPVGESLVAFLHDRVTKSSVRVSAEPGGGPPAGDSYIDALSADGRYATFTSDDPLLATGGAPGFFRTFVYDRLTGTLSSVAISEAGYIADDNAFSARPSGDGRFLSFWSYGSNLTPGDGNGVADVFVIDRGSARADLAVRLAGTVPFAGHGIMQPKVNQRIGIDVAEGSNARFDVRLQNAGGVQAFVLKAGPGAATSWSLKAVEVSGSADVTEALTGQGWTTPVLEGGGEITLRIEVARAAGGGGEAVYAPRIVARSVGGSEELDAVNLVAKTSLPPPGFVLVSRATNGVPAIRNADVSGVSADGSRVVFSSESDDLDGRGDFNFQSDVFLVDRTAGTVSRISDASLTAQADADSRYPSISGDGRRVAFQSRATNLVPFDDNEVEDIFVCDLGTRGMGRVSVSTGGQEGDRGSESAVISGGGRYVVFTSFASNLVPGDTNACQDVFMRDLDSGATECVSCTAAGELGNADSEGGTPTADGRFVVFTSLASNLGPPDDNGFADVYLWNREDRTIQLISRTAEGRAGNGVSGGGSISDDGQWVAFVSYASDLLPGGSFTERRGYLLDRGTGTLRTLSEVVPPLPSGLEARVAVVSPDGRRLAIAAASPCGGPPASQVLVFDRVRGALSVVSGLRDGSLGLDHTLINRWSADGRYLTFESYARNLLLEWAPPAGEVYLADLAEALPDEMVRGSGDWRGAGVTNGVQLQTAVQLLLEEPTGAPGLFVVRVRNGGNLADHYLFAAPVWADSRAKVSFHTDPAAGPGSEVPVAGPGWQSPSVAPGGGFDLYVRVAYSAPVETEVNFNVAVRSILDPRRGDEIRVIARMDFDGDSIPDTWERQYFGTTTIAGVGTDGDGDGAADVEEWAAGTDPTNPADFLVLDLGKAAPMTPVELSWNSAPGVYYGVESSQDPGANFTNRLRIPIPGTGEILRWTDEIPAEDGAPRFYRLRADLP